MTMSPEQAKVAMRRFAERSDLDEAVQAGERLSGRLLVVEAERPQVGNLRCPTCVIFGLAAVNLCAVTAPEASAWGDSTFVEQVLHAGWAWVDEREWLICGRCATIRDLKVAIRAVIGPSEGME